MAKIKDPENHMGKNLRNIRLLRGMKQETFGKEMGIAQQNVSKMEKKKKISDEQLEQAAKILSTTAETIKSFNEKAVFQSNIFNEHQVNNFNPVKEILQYFEEKLEKKDTEIEKLRAELENYRSYSSNSANTTNSKSSQTESDKRKAAATEGKGTDKKLKAV